MRATSLVLAAAALASCQVGGPLLIGDPHVEAVRADIHAEWQAHIEAAQAQDLDGVVAMYSDDAIYVIPGLEPVRGKEALRAMEQNGLEQGKVVEARHSTQALRLSGDLAYELSTITGTVQPVGEAPQRVTFHFAAVWQFQTDGRWRLLTITGR